MMAQREGKKSVFRVLNIVILAIFTLQQVVWAQGEPLSIRPGTQGLQMNAADYLKDLSIPQDKAITKEINLDLSSEIIINIQDAHDSLSAQYSIVDILDALAKNYNLSLVALEGSSGYIDTSLLKTFPIDDIKRSTAGHLMKEGQLSAGEFFSIVNDKKDITLYGIENNKLYRKHVELFIKNIDNKKDMLEKVGLLLSYLKTIEATLMPESIIELNKRAEGYKEGQDSLRDYWSYINAHKAFKGTEGYPNVDKLSKSIEMEKAIDFKEANRERELIISDLNKSLPKEDLEMLVLKSLQY